MRTLKKSLALVLALVMLLGLGVVGASADNALDNYTDADEIGDAYLEAVGVLTGLGIVDGMTETTIVPQATYTRAQAAKIITTMVLGVNGAKSCVASYAPFDDVAANHWAAGYIAFCKEQGIIDGVTDTTFDPEGTLTGYQWAKMLLAAVGFNANNELEGSSWSLNTARIGREVGLFDGDLAGADHTPLRREQAMLYAFNTLSGIKQVTYSANATNYVYGIKGYVFADGTGYTLGEKVFDLAMVEGQIIDNEGMGASKTYVDNVNDSKWTSKDDVIAVSADTGLDLMYHAVRVWYVDGKTNTNVYVCDLAKTTVYECMAIATGDKDANKLGTAKVEKQTIGDTKATAYETYLIDNSALDLAKDYSYVTVYASFGTRGYADAVKDTTVIGTTTVKNDNIYTDISEIDYKDGIVYIAAESKLSDGEAWHVWATTATSGVIKSIQKEDGVVISVTLADGTVLKKSTLNGTDVLDRFVTGQVYNFVLDTHGDIIYTTLNGARDLYVFTGSTRDGDTDSPWSDDQYTEYRFLNVTTGDEYVVPAVFRTLDGGVATAKRGQYYDISAEPMSNGQYVARLVTEGANTYADGYIVDNIVAARRNTNSSLYYFNGSNDNTVYFDANTVTIIVATGKGEGMTVDTYTGLAELTEHYNVAANGRVTLNHAALTVDKTSTGNYNASVIFVLADNLYTVSNYVFIPEDIDVNDWHEITGDPAGYTVSYNGAYLEGEKISVTFNAKSLGWAAFGRNSTLDRGFYTLYYSAGTDTYWLRERIDNGVGDCYYLDVKLIDTGITTNAVWGFDTNGDGRADFDVYEGECKVTDLSGHGITTLAGLAQYMEYDDHDYEPVSIAFTVDPATNRVDYVYVVEAGWDAQVTIGLTEDLQDAGWVITSINGVSYDAKDEIVSKTFNDAEAEKLINDGLNITIYNAKLADRFTSTTEFTYSINDNANGGVSKLDNGKISVVVDVNSMTLGSKTQNFTIGGLVIGDVTFAIDESQASNIEISKAYGTVTYKDVVLGQTLEQTVTPTNGGNWQSEAGKYWDAHATDGSNNNYDIVGTLSGNYKYVNFTVDAFLSGTYTITADAWVPYPNA